MTPISNLATIDKKKAARKRNFLIALVVTLLALIGFATYTWGRSTEQKNNDAIARKTDDTKKEAPIVEDSDIITTPLPNGKTATYDSTVGNQNIEFSSSERGANYVSLSYKAVAEFISAVDESTLTKLCGANGELAQRDDVIVGVMSTSVRSIEYPTASNCLDELATLRNTNPTSRAAAAKLVKQVAADVRQFYTTVIIK